MTRRNNRIKFVCATCGSQDIKALAMVKWDIDAQIWQIDCTFVNKGAVCFGECGGSTTTLETKEEMDQ